MDLKIAWAVIPLLAVDVVDFLVVLQRSPQHILGYDDVLEDITVLCSRVSRIIDHRVALGVDGYAAFPMVVKLPGLIRMRQRTISRSYGQGLGKDHRL